MATPYNGFDLPVVGADADTWGGKLNTIMESIDTLLSSPANTIKGNNTGSQVSSLNLTPAQVTAMLPAVVADSGSGGTKGLVPAPPAGSAAQNKFLAANGTWKSAGVFAWARINGSTGALIAGYNVASVAREALGIYSMTMSVAAPDANYGVQATARGISQTFFFATEDGNFTRTTTKVQVRTMRVLVTPEASIQDAGEVTITVYAA